MTAPSLSVVLCTHNRAALLPPALHALLDQEPPVENEIIVVDNCSTDATRDVVESIARSSSRLRYVFEPELGLSAARNTGIAHARAELIAFTDDDVRASRTWTSALVACFAAHPEADWVGGKVVPEWTSPPPRWLSAAGLAPLALNDFGDEPFAVSPARPVCLIGANLAVRRRAFDRVGLFSRRVQRLGEGAGSTEDHELQIRFLNAGLIGRYDPRILVRAPVSRERLEKHYHREWHSGHGRSYALMRDPSFERSARTVLGVPAHVYRAAAGELGAWLSAVLAGRRAAAFAHELRLRFLMSYARQRVFGSSAS
jgi:glycosyltransferase involved in cell wall biosynthesis